MLNHQLRQMRFQAVPYPYLHIPNAPPVCTEDSFLTQPPLALTWNLNGRNNLIAWNTQKTVG